jgi:hypothetical protein
MAIVFRADHLGFESPGVPRTSTATGSIGPSVSSSSTPGTAGSTPSGVNPPRAVIGHRVRLPGIGRCGQRSPEQQAGVEAQPYGDVLLGRDHLEDAALSVRVEARVDYEVDRLRSSGHNERAGMFSPAKFERESARVGHSTSRAWYGPSRVPIWSSSRPCRQLICSGFLSMGRLRRPSPMVGAGASGLVDGGRW